MYSKQSAGIFRPRLLLSLLALLVSCGDDNDSDGSGPSLSSGKAITEFSFTSAENPQMGSGPHEGDRRGGGHDHAGRASGLPITVMPDAVSPSSIRCC